MLQSFFIRMRCITVPLLLLQFQGMLYCNSSRFPQNSHPINLRQCDPMYRQSICRLMQQISMLYLGCLNLLMYILALTGDSQYTEKELFMFKN